MPNLQVADNQYALSTSLLFSINRSPCQGLLFNKTTACYLEGSAEDNK
jgi:hypothetical protein